MYSYRRVAWQVSVLTFMAVVRVCDAAPWKAISWTGNTLEWNQKLGVSEHRQGCTSSPPGCLQAVDRSARAGGVDQVTLAITDDPEKIAAYALEYSAASLQEHRLRGIGLDDALSVFAQWQKQGRDPAAMLQEVIANTKAKNPHLEFGITLYENELSHPLLVTLPANVKASVDRVHLYAQYRQDGPRFAEYVQQAKKLFPRAAIIAGIYPYDRIDYLPCTIEKKSPCTLLGEKQLYEQTLRIQASMVLAGQVAALEFYPGTFGSEDNWTGWQKPNICRAGRVQSCIAITKEMHATTQQVLDSLRK